MKYVINITKTWEAKKNILGEIGIYIFIIKINPQFL